MPNKIQRAITIVQGAQWGSEAKGAIAAYLVHDMGIKHIVRTGAINAGHTFYVGDVAYKMQQLPVGWDKWDANLVIGAGAYVHPPTLDREVMMVAKAADAARAGKAGNPMQRLFIDERCAVHDQMAEAESKKANRHHAMGATGKGCSQAIVSKINMRGEEVTDMGRERRNPVLFSDHPYSLPFGARLTDTEEMLNSAYDRGEGILLEGTQGSLLDLHLGPYPYTTSRMTSAANWVAECGLSPSLAYMPVLVARTYPIRVAGNSGPMPNEMCWPDLVRNMNYIREGHRLPPILDEVAIRHFEYSLERVAKEQFGNDLPLGSLGHDQHLWAPDQRVKHRVALSELHAAALRYMEDRYTPSYNDLIKVFELTTVTRKLRRIAKLDLTLLKIAVRQTRPAYIALTFLNYEFPHLWNEEDSDKVRDDREVRAYITQIENAVGVEVGLVSTGPRSCHIHRY